MLRVPRARPRSWVRACGAAAGPRTSSARLTSPCEGALSWCRIAACRCAPPECSSGPCPAPLLCVQDFVRGSAFRNTSSRPPAPKLRLEPGHGRWRGECHLVWLGGSEPCDFVTSEGTRAPFFLPLPLATCLDGCPVPALPGLR